MKKISALLYTIALVTGVFTLNAQATIYHVTKTGAGTKDGLSWENAYQGFESCGSFTSGDQIWAAKGTYKPFYAYEMGGTRFYHFRMVNGGAIYGGFAGTETATNQRINYGVGQANETILSGDLDSDGRDNDDCYHVIYNPSGLGLTSSAILDGFTIKGGNANGTAPHNYGGGIYNNSNSPTIRNCTISDNAAAYGGGTYNESGNPSITNCLFSNNTATTQGGGIYSNISSSPSVINCVFSTNSAAWGGGLSYNSSNGNATITNCTFTSNSASSGGGGMYIANTPTYTTINNSIIWGNAAPYGNQIYTTGYETLNNTCISNGTGDIDGTLNSYSNLIFTDPQFATASSYPYNIYGTSPCADAGNNSYISESYDIRGSSYPRKLNKTDGTSGTVDMGAYEYKYATDYYNEDGSLPVTLSNFSAKVVSNGVLLNWTTESEIENLGFILERKIVWANHDLPSSWSQIASYVTDKMLEGHGSTSAKHEYQFTDKAVQPGATYHYRLADVDYSGSVTWHKEVEVKVEAEDGTVAEDFHLGNVHPNPFNASFTIPLTLSKTAPVKLALYDLNGKVVKVIENGIKPAGEYRIAVDCRELSSGIYFLQSNIQHIIRIQKVILVK